MKLFELHPASSYATKLIQVIRTTEPDTIDDLAVIFNTYGINIYAPIDEIKEQLSSMDTGETRDSPIRKLYNKVANYVNMGV